MITAAAVSQPSYTLLVVIVSRKKLTGAANIQVFDSEGRSLASLPSAMPIGMETFAVPLTSALPESFKVTATVDGIQYAAAVENYKKGAVAVGLVSSRISAYIDAHPGTTIAAARALSTKLVLGHIAPAGPPVESGDDGGASDGSADDADTSATGGLFQTLASSMGSSLLSSISNSLKAPLIGWLTQYLSAGGLGGASGSASLQTIAGQISALTDDVTNISSQISQAVNQLLDQSDANTLSTVTAYVEKYGSTAGTQGPPSDIISDSTKGTYPQLVHDVLVGTAAVGSTPFLTSFRNNNAPKFYCDETQLQVLLGQIDYYQNAQFVMTNLLMEALHSQSWGADYTNAGSTYQNYVNFVQQENTFLPFPTGDLFEQKGIFQQSANMVWYKQNLGSVATFALLVNLGLYLQTNDVSFYLAPRIADLQSLISDAESACKTMGLPVGSPEQNLNALGFNVSFSNPLLVAESISDFVYNVAGSKWDSTYYKFPMFDAVGNQKVYMVVKCSSYSGDFATDMPNANWVGWYPDPNGTPTVLDKDGYIDLLPMYALDLSLGQPLEEPSQISIDTPGPVKSGVQVLTASGSFNRYSSFGVNGLKGSFIAISKNVQYDVTQGCYWTVDKPEVAAISNDGDTVRLSWLGSGSSVIVTALRGSLLSANLTIDPPGQTVAAAKPASVNVYPQTLSIQSSDLPVAKKTLNVQIVNSDASMDPIANGWGNAPSEPWPTSSFTYESSDQTNVPVNADGTYSVGPNATGKVTITATLTSNPKLFATLTITIT